MRRFPRFWALLAAAAGVQTAVLCGMVYDRISLLRTGREVVLEVTPVDPRSLFRGDYVILSYAASRLPGNLVPEGHLTTATPIYVTLARRENAWTPVAASKSHPGEIAGDHVVLRGWPSHPLSNEPAAPRSSLLMRYGVESYFVPEGTGRALEALVGEKKVAVVLSVSASGAAAIKGLIADGKTVYVEPPL